MAHRPDQGVGVNVNVNDTAIGAFSGFGNVTEDMALRTQATTDASPRPPLVAVVKG